mmetsp:Transcript_21340/g.44374  ORF Transcript_21340/g.44374 Transcript_21340/m.44374 type:complete len:331 (+) Transcript_21340:138-1130(+)
MTVRQRNPSKNDREEEEDLSPSKLVPSANSSWDKCIDDEESSSHENGTQQPLVEAIISTKQQEHQKTATPPPPPSALDNFLSFYSTFSYGTFTADQGLKILQWSSWAIAYLTASSSLNSRFKNKHISPSFRHIYNDLSMARYALRFYGFFQSLEGYRSGSWAGGTWENPLIAKIAKYLMCGSMLIYYPLEHVAYAGWQMPKVVRVDANRFSAVSCRYWCAYIVGDLLVSCLKWRELKKKLTEAGQRLLWKKKEDDKDGIITALEEQKTIIKNLRHVKIQVIRCLLFILPAIHWSLPNWATDPWLSEPVVNGLMLGEAYTCVYQSIRNICG